MVINGAMLPTFLAASKCADDRLKPFNGTCYLFVSYPEVDWFTAQQVCAGIHGELASVNTAEEQRYFYNPHIDIARIAKLTENYSMLISLVISDSSPQIFETNWTTRHKQSIGSVANSSRTNI